MGAFRLFYLLVLIIWPFGAGGQFLYFDTGLPSTPYPSIAGTNTAMFTPMHDMVISSALGTNTFGTGGHIMSVEFSLNGTLLGVGTGGKFNNVPASFTPPLALHGGVTYGLEVITSSYPQLFHVSEIATADAIISNIQFVDINGMQSMIAFPVLRLYGPAPVPPLGIQRSNEVVVVSWPSYATNYSLEKSTNFSVLSSWLTVQQPSVTNVAQISVTIPTSAEQMFFRLKSPY
jgi:hypothetical protein